MDFQALELARLIINPQSAYHCSQRGVSPAEPDFTNDVKDIRDSLSRLANEGKDIIFVSHSYTGMPSAEAPAGLGQKEREENGLLKGGVFIMSFATSDGFQRTAGDPPLHMPDWMKVDCDGNNLPVRLIITKNHLTDSGCRRGSLALIPKTQKDPI